MTETKMHYFALHFQKILAATKGWKDDAFGAYIKLLIEQFDRGYVPDDPAEISMLITSFKKNWPRLKKKFTEPSEPGKLRNTFMCGVREEAHEKSAKNAENGSKGGKAKKANAVANGIPNATANANKTLQRNGSQPVTSNHKTIPKEEVVVMDAWFQMFRRAAGAHIDNDTLFLEIGKFKNRYPNQNLNQAGALINAWIGNIGRMEAEKAEAAANPVKKMAI